MSMLVAFVLASAPVAAPDEASEANEITVIALKMRKGRIKTTYSDNGARNCQVIRSTGDAEIDAIGCEAMRQCDEANAAAVRAVFDPALPRRDRQARLRDYRRDVQTPCYFERRDEMKAALARARVGRRP